MSTAIQPASTWSRWRRQPSSDTNAGELQVSRGIVPDLAAAERLLERLVRRSTESGGLDRAALLQLNREAWGFNEE
jgi:hypothetical protein